MVFSLSLRNLLQGTLSVRQFEIEISYKCRKNNSKLLGVFTVARIKLERNYYDGEH